MISNKKGGVLRAGVGYTLANILIRGIGFLTLPIFSRLLDTEAFGVYNVFIAYDAILFCIVGLALHSSVKSANWEFPGEIDSYISSVSLIYICLALLLLALTVCFGGYIVEVIGLSFWVLISLIFHSFGTAVVTLYNSRISLQYSFRKYMIVALLSSVGNVALSLCLVLSVFSTDRAMGRIVGATAALFFTGLIIIVVFWRRAKPTVNIKYWTFGVRYSIPIVFHGISQVLLGQTGRLMTNYLVSTSAAGIYGLSANLLVIESVLTDSISTVWSTWFYEAMENEDASNATASKRLDAAQRNDKKQIVQHRSNQLQIGFGLVTVALMAFAPEFVWVLGGNAYMEGVPCAYGMIVSGYLVFLYNLIVVGEYYVQKTNWVMAGTILAAFVNIVLNYLVIANFGYVASAYATVISYFIYVVFHWLICRRLLGYSILSWKTFGLLLAIIAALTVVDLLMVEHLAARIIVGSGVIGVLLLIGVRRFGWNANALKVI